MSDVKPDSAAAGAEPGPLRDALTDLWDRIQSWMRSWGRPPKIGLALGSGGAWGVAHIGVLRAFEELGIPIALLAGTSAGSLVGALYAGGVRGDRLEQCGQSYGWRQAGRLNVLPKMGLASNARMAQYLQQHIGNPRFEALDLPFFVAATNLDRGELKVFDHGPVIPAVRASCAIPGIFEPVEIEGKLYCDGGVISRNPCRVLRAAGAEFVIGVDLSASDHGKRPANIQEVILRALDIALLPQADSENRAADLMIRPDIGDIQALDFSRNRLLIARGRDAALDPLQRWRHAMGLALEPNTESS